MRSVEASILVVENDAELLFQMQRVLCDHGFCVTPARSAQEAAEVSNGKAFQWLIADVRLRTMTGRQLLQQLTPRIRGDLRAILTSSGQQAGVRVHSQGHRLQYSIRKPVHWPVLLTLLGCTVEGGHGLPRPVSSSLGFALPDDPDFSVLWNSGMGSSAERSA